MRGLVDWNCWCLHRSESSKYQWSATRISMEPPRGTVSGPISQTGSNAAAGPTQFVRQPKPAKVTNATAEGTLSFPRPSSPTPTGSNGTWEPNGSNGDAKRDGESLPAPTSGWFDSTGAPSPQPQFTLQSPVPVNAVELGSSAQNSQTDSNTTAGQWQQLPPQGMAFVSAPSPQSDVAGLPDRRNLDPQFAKQGIAVPTGPMRTAEQAQPSIQDQMLLEDKERRHRIGSLVSRQLLEDADAPIESQPPAIEPPKGWRAIEKELRERLDRCDHLLRRSAVQSGRQEILVAMRQLMRALDERRGEWRSEPHLDLALQAFREEADFHASLKSPEQAVSVARIVESHQTPVLKGMQLESLAPDTAAQYYHQYAKDQLVLAAERHGFASDLYYAYGKCLERVASDEPAERTMFLSQAAVCYQAALIIRADQSHAANELGYVLLQLDRNAEAFDALQYSLKLRPTPETYRNLVEVYRRHNDRGGQQWAVNQLASLDQKQAGPTANLPVVQEVSPEMFASMSPRNDAQFANIPNPAAMMPPQSMAPRGNAPSAPAAQTANGNWFQRMTR